MAIAFPIISFAEGTNIYQVNLRQYTPEGSIQAFQTHLPRLKEMGVHVLWFMPLTPISTFNRKGTMGSYYAAKSFHSICDSYGTAEDFRNLVATAHALEMKVMIDWVANHTGCDHEWTLSNPDFYCRNETGNFIEKHGWSDVYDLNYNNPALRTAMIDSMLHWIREYNIDGFRCDMAHLVPLDFWIQARAECDSVKQLLWLAECEDVSYHQVFDLTYSWQWMHATEAACKEESKWSEARNVFIQYLAYPKRSAKLLFTTNHDENSWNGTEYEKYNSRALALAALSIGAPAVPLIYSGQEIPNHKRLEFFEKDPLNFSQPIALHSFYRILLNAKRNNPCLHLDATVLLLQTQHDGIFALLQMNKTSKGILIFNMTTNEQSIRIESKMLVGSYQDIFSNAEYGISDVFETRLEEGAFMILVSKMQG